MKKCGRFVLYHNKLGEESYLSKAMSDRKETLRVGNLYVPAKTTMIQKKDEQEFKE